MIPRHLAPILKTVAAQYPIVSVTGPRQSGKTTLVRVHVACGDLTGDNVPEIIVARAALAKPEVRVFHGGTAVPLVGPFGSFLAFNENFLGGVRVAACDLNQDGTTDIIAGRGPGGQPKVRAFDGVSGTAFLTPIGSFLAASASFRGGVYVACSPSDSGGGPPPADTAPAVTSTTPSNGATGVTTNSNLTIAFNEPVNVAGNWFQVNCPTSGVRNVADTVVTGGPTTFTIDPAPTPTAPTGDFAPGEACTTRHIDVVVGVGAADRAVRKRGVPVKLFKADAGPPGTLPMTWAASGISRCASAAPPARTTPRLESSGWSVSSATA